MMTLYADLAELPEDDRIALIARAASAGQLVGFIVDDDEKADRYVAKLRAYPVRIVDRQAGPVANTVLVRVGPMES